MRGKPAILDDFSGGVDVVNSPRELPPNTASDALDVVPSSNGKSIKSRYSKETVATLGGTAETIYYSSIIGDYLYARDNGDLYYLTGGTSTLLHAAGGGTFSGYGWSIEQGADGAGGVGLFFMHPVLTPQVWSGSGAAANWTGPPAGGRQILWRSNRMWLIKGDAVYWSELANAGSTGWPATNVVKLQPGEDLEAIVNCGPYIAVFSARKVWIIYDFDTGANRLVTDQHGVYRHTAFLGTPNSYASRLATATENGCFFADATNIYFTDGNTVEPVADQVGSLLGITMAGAMAFDGRFLYVGEASVYVYDTVLKSWWPQSLQMTCMTHPVGSESIAFSTSSTLAKWGPRYSTSDTETIAAYWKREKMDFGSSLRKRLRSLQITGNTSAPLPIGGSAIDSVTIYRDAAQVTNTPTFADYKARLPGAGVGREWGIKVAGTDTKQWELFEIAFWLQQRKD